MREKLLDLMKSEGLKPSQLAELLGVNPAGISHILAGRNKPGFDLLQKILRRFPQINPDWLLLDSQQMYRTENGRRSPDANEGRTPDAASDPERGTPVSGSGLFGGLFAGSGMPASRNSAGPLPDGGRADSRRGDGMSGIQGNGPDGGPQHASGENPECRIQNGVRAGERVPVTRVVICYADGTFESYAPTRR